MVISKCFITLSSPSGSPSLSLSLYPSLSLFVFSLSLPPKESFIAGSKNSLLFIPIEKALVLFP